MTSGAKQPNLFIVGAPRSGTTAMRQYLSKHPEIEFSAIREPNFFNADFSQQLRKFTDSQAYERECFGHIEDSPAYVAEKTVWYLYSQTAIESIAQYNSSAKLLVMLRDPVSMVQSLHSKLYEIQQETQEDFECAWNLQSERANGTNVPASCPDKKILLYGQVAAYGKQIQRLQSLVPEEQTKVIIFDDFANTTKQTYDGVLKFLGLSTSDYPDFSVVNGRKKIRNQSLQYALRQGSQLVYQSVFHISERIKSSLGIRRWHAMKRLSSLNTKPASTGTLSDSFAKELQDYFRDDVQKLSETLDRDLSHWLEH